MGIWGPTAVCCIPPCLRGCSLTQGMVSLNKKPALLVTVLQGRRKFGNEAGMCWFGMDTAVSILNQRPLSPVTLTPALTGSDISSPRHHLEENAHMSLSQQQSHLSYQQGLLLMALQAGTRSQRGWEAFWAAWSPASLHQPQELPQRCSSGPNTQKTHESFSRSCICAKCLEKNPRNQGRSMPWLTPPTG